MLAGAIATCTLLEGDDTEPGVVTGLGAVLPLEVLDEVLGDVEVLDAEMVLAVVPPPEEVALVADVSALDADAPPEEPPDDPPDVPELVEPLVAATTAGGALDAAAKMKLGVGT
jgi:hypothetical protein